MLITNSVDDLWSTSDQPVKTCVWSSLYQNSSWQWQTTCHKDVSDYFELEGLIIILHSSNSPDLSQCAFWLFNSLKDNLNDQDDLGSLHGAMIDFMNSSNWGEQKISSGNESKGCNCV